MIIQIRCDILDVKILHIRPYSADHVLTIASYVRWWNHTGCRVWYYCLQYPDSILKVYKIPEWYRMVQYCESILDTVILLLFEVVWQYQMYNLHYFHNIFLNILTKKQKYCIEKYCRVTIWYDFSNVPPHIIRVSLPSYHLTMVPRSIKGVLRPHLFILALYFPL